MKNHIIDFKDCLASIPNNDLELAANIFAKELEDRGLITNEKIREIQAKIKFLEDRLEDLRIEFQKKPEWKFVVKKFISPEYVLGLVSEAFGVSPEQIKGKNRHGTVVMARHTYRYIMYNIGWGSLDDVASLTEGDAKTSRHAAVINSIEKVEALRFDKKYKSVVEFADNLVSEIKSQINDSIRKGE